MKRKNILITLVMVIATFFVGAYVVLADAVVNAPNHLTIDSYRKSGGNNPLKLSDGFTIKHTSDGKYVYCIDYVLKRAEGLKYNKLSGSHDAGLSYIVNQGYNNKTEEEYFITQSAIWLYLDDKGMMKKDTTGVIDRLRDAVYKSKASDPVSVKIRELVSIAKNAKEAEKPYLEITSKNVDFELDKDGKYYVSLIKVDTNLYDYDVKLVNAPKSAKHIGSNEGIYIYILASELEEVGADFRVELSGTKEVYSTVLYEASVSGYQPVAVPYSEKVNVKDSIGVEVDTTIVSISKKDATTKKELPGATLVLKNEKGDIVETWVSTDEEHLIYNLPLGKYTLIETKAPEGYELSKEEITFELTQLGVKKKVTMYNDVEEITEVPVEPTSSFASILPSTIGLIIISIGSILIFKNYKKNER